MEQGEQTSNQPSSKPIEQSSRIELLDIIRGFALLGILLVNIIGFGLHSAAYLNPGLDVDLGWNPDTFAWISIELFAEGAMRALFSMLFGAGVALYTLGPRAKSGRLHYKRTAWLFLFGLCNAYLLLWNGDILVTYALAGSILYLFRNLKARTLLILGSLLILLLSGAYGLLRFGIAHSYHAAQSISSLPIGESPDPALEEGAAVWEEVQHEFAPSPEAVEDELQQRRASYASAFTWNSTISTEMILFVTPIFLLWDSLAMMFLGMGLLKLNILRGERSRFFYIGLMILGFTMGLILNGLEISRSIRSDMNLLNVIPLMQPTYHLGRLAIALGYIGLLGWVAQNRQRGSLLAGLAAVGRLALTNYLMQSTLCAILFTGAGFALVGEVGRAMLYPIVLGIWIVQIVFSRYWIKHFRFGPMEWLWRALVYGYRPPFRKVSERPPADSS